MPTYYVDGTNGNDADDGLDPFPQGGGVGPKLTLNGAEDIPVVADDKVWVRPDVYREQLTIDVAGGAGTPIVYEGDVTGQIWGVGGIVRVTGSDNDTTITRTRTIACFAARNYRTFRGFYFDSTSSYLIECSNSPTNWIIEDCVFNPGSNRSIRLHGDAQADWIIRRCLFLGAVYTIFQITFVSPAGIQDAGHLVQNCLFSLMGRGIESDDVGGVTVRACTFLGITYAFRVTDALPVGFTACVVEDCIISKCEQGLRAQVLGEIVEDFNNFYQNNTDRFRVNVGANSQTYITLLQPPILFAGAGQISGFKYPWWLGELSEWDALGAITGSNEPTVDLRGFARPTTASKNSWGALQYADAERDTGTVYEGSASYAFLDAGRIQFKVPCTTRSYMVRVRVQREANYAGVNPQIVIKQPGQADRTTTDAGAAGAWNLLEDTFIPAADPGYFFVELVSNNTNGANDIVYFDDLEIRGEPQNPGEFEHWLWDRQPFETLPANPLVVHGREYRRRRMPGPVSAMDAQ